jgi:hypothetical protein
MITRLLCISALACITACSRATSTEFTTGGDSLAAEPGRVYRWGFDEDAPGAPPAALISVLGDWKTAADPGAPSAPNALQQAGRYARPDFPRAIVRDLEFQNLRLQVRCRPDSGEVDQVCGLMFRLRDGENYYVTRANALEGNVRLYRVVNGDRQQFATADLPVTSGQWHTLAVEARGDNLSVWWNGARVIEARDSTFSNGKIGVWTKADSITAFDDLEATEEAAP